MSTYISREVQAGLFAAQKSALKKKSRLRVSAGDKAFSILRFCENSFALDADDLPHLRGLVDIYDGSRHLYQALIVASEQIEGEVVFEFKRNTVASDAPALDFERDDKAPIAFIAKT